jgi:ubiquinone biosynthesis protein
MKDLLKTARILSRFGPKLPQMAEAALIKTYNTSHKGPKRTTHIKRWFFLALALGLSVGWIAAQLL